MKTYEVVDLHDLQFVKDAGDEQIYLCPFCVEKVGKEDKTGKLWFNIVKRLGRCWRCDSVIFDEKDQEQRCSILNNVDHIRVPSLSSQYEHMISTLHAPKQWKEPQPISFAFPELDAVCYAYLKERNRFLSDVTFTKIFLGLRMWCGSSTGIVIPFFYNNVIVHFQVRFLHPQEGQPKYYTAPGTKLPYVPNKQLGRPQWSITLCEGVFDAIALFCIGYPCPVAVLGKTVTQYQLQFLRKMVPQHIIYAFDEKEISYTVRADLAGHLPSVQSSAIFCPWDGLPGKHDPESWLKEDETVKVNEMLFREQLRYMVKENR